MLPCQFFGQFLANLVWKGIAWYAKQLAAQAHFFLEKIPLIYWSSILPWSYSPELLKKRRIYHNHSWKSTLNTTHCHNEKKLKLKQNNKKSRNISKKGILLHTTQSKMYCSILVSCLNKRLQSGGIEKKWKKNCSKMTKLKRKGRTKKIWIYLLCNIRTLSQWLEGVH